MSTQNILNILRGIVNEPVANTNNQNIDPTDYINLGEANFRLFGVAEPPVLTPQNITTAIAVQSAIIPDNSGISTNIGSFFGVNMAVSGTWKITLVISDGTYSRTESHHYGPEKSLSDAENMANQLASKRSELLGRTLSGADFIVSTGNPGVQYARISDSFNPRVVSLLDFSETPYAGWVPGVNTGADFSGVATMVRLRGQNLNDATVEQETTLGVVMQPDAVCNAGKYAGKTISVKAGLTYDAALQNYLNFLSNPINKLGFVGTSLFNAKKDCTNFALQDNGLWQFKSTAAGFVTGDKVRITGANNPKFNGTYKLIKIDNDTFQIAKGLNSDLAVPTLAKARKIQNANGSRALDFYKYIAKPMQVRIRGRKPGRAFSPISFRKKPRK